MLVDTHCHLDYGEFDNDLEEVMGRCQGMLVVNSIVQPDAVEKGLRLSEEYDNIHCTLGLTASDVDEDRFKEAKRLVREHRDRIVGLGEVGLDYYWVKNEEEREVERRHFREFIELSRDLKLPLVVHSRDAEGDCINILEGCKSRAMMHCFSGPPEEALKAVKMGCLISVPANVAYVKSRQRLVEALPLESLVLETDSPYLSPVKGFRNEPANVKYAAEKIAELKGVKVKEVEDATSENALEYFSIVL
ncbi:MAG: YchF/TatD family DNA exonuclease [Candidatus Altiarchaeales archaeon]|nr:YchF/TatD family DNA exonuclease [Candidatus Altiarchaeales archaeon]MBD3417202.1 YchF/TatD family DNA exonuclease [Candidatus Altiarchaeales archaeon]